MFAPRPQRTLERPAVVAGFGLWSSRDCRVEFHPAPADTGIVFVRTDLPTPVRIPAHVTRRVESPRRTNLCVGHVAVEMVEHILAALAGLQIDNCEVRVDAEEMPGCDGSASAFVAALDAAGIVTQNAPRRTLLVRQTIRVGTSDSWVEARPTGTQGMSVRFQLDYGPHSPIVKQSITLPVTPDSFRRELANCRTFVLQSEAQWLRSRGLAQRASYNDLLVFDQQGPIENQLRRHDECARHKALDLVGDLALAGVDLVGHFVAHRSGHRLNAELVRMLLSECEVTHDRRMCA